MALFSNEVKSNGTAQKVNGSSLTGTFKASAQNVVLTKQEVTSARNVGCGLIHSNLKTPSASLINQVPF